MGRELRKKWCCKAALALSWPLDRLLQQGLALARVIRVFVSTEDDLLYSERRSTKRRSMTVEDNDDNEIVRVW
jgi:hypothetical protein